MTKTEHPPKLSRQALLALVEWVSKNKKRSRCVEFHGMGETPIREPETVNQFIGKISTEAVERSGNRENESC